VFGSNIQPLAHGSRRHQSYLDQEDAYLEDLVDQIAEKNYGPLEEGDTARTDFQNLYVGFVKEMQATGQDPRLLETVTHQLHYFMSTAHAIMDENEELCNRSVKDSQRGAGAMIIVNAYRYHRKRLLVIGMQQWHAAYRQDKVTIYIKKWRGDLAERAFNKWHKFHVQVKARRKFPVMLRRWRAGDVRRAFVAWRANSQRSMVSAMAAKVSKSNLKIMRLSEWHKRNCHAWSRELLRRHWVLWGAFWRKSLNDKARRARILLTRMRHNDRMSIHFAFKAWFMDCHANAHFEVGSQRILEELDGKHDEVMSLKAKVASLQAELGEVKAQLAKVEAQRSVVLEQRNKLQLEKQSALEMVFRHLCIVTARKSVSVCFSLWQSFAHVHSRKGHVQDMMMRFEEEKRSIVERYELEQQILANQVVASRHSNGLNLVSKCLRQSERDNVRYAFKQWSISIAALVHHENLGKRKMTDALSLIFRQYAASHRNSHLKVLAATFFKWLRILREMANVDELRRMELEQEHQRQKIKSNATIKFLLKWLKRKQAQAFNKLLAVLRYMQHTEDLCRKVMRKMMAAQLHAGFSTWMGVTRMMAKSELEAAHILSLNEASAAHEASLRALREQSARSLEDMRQKALMAKQTQLVSMVVNTLQGGAHSIMRRALTAWTDLVAEYRIVQESNRAKQIRFFHMMEERGTKSELRDQMRMFHRWCEWCMEDKHRSSYNRLSQISKTEYASMVAQLEEAKRQQEQINDNKKRKVLNHLANMYTDLAFRAWESVVAQYHHDQKLMAKFIGRFKNSALSGAMMTWRRAVKCMKEMDEEARANEEQAARQSEAKASRNQLMGAVQTRNGKRLKSRAFMKWYRCFVYSLSRQCGMLQGKLNKLERTYIITSRWAIWKKQLATTRHGQRAVSRALLHLMNAKKTIGMTTWRHYVHMHRLAERTLRTMLKVKIHTALHTWRGFVKFHSELSCLVRGVDKMLLQISLKLAVEKWSQLANTKAKTAKLVRRWMHAVTYAAFRRLVKQSAELTIHNLKQEHRTSKIRSVLRLAMRLEWSKLGPSFSRWKQRAATISNLRRSFALVTNRMSKSSSRSRLRIAMATWRESLERLDRVAALVSRVISRWMAMDTATAFKEWLAFARLKTSLRDRMAMLMTSSKKNNVTYAFRTWHRYARFASRANYAAAWVRKSLVQKASNLLKMAMRQWCNAVTMWIRDELGLKLMDEAERVKSLTLTVTTLQSEKQAVADQLSYCMHVLEYVRRVSRDG